MELIICIIGLFLTVLFVADSFGNLLPSKSIEPAVSKVLNANSNSQFNIEERDDSSRQCQECEEPEYYWYAIPCDDVCYQPGYPKCTKTTTINCNTTIPASEVLHRVGNLSTLITIQIVGYKKAAKVKFDVMFGSVDSSTVVLEKDVVVTSMNLKNGRYTVLVLNLGIELSAQIKESLIVSLHAEVCND